jgi:hypothetical protein
MVMATHLIFLWEIGRHVLEHISSRRDHSVSVISRQALSASIAELPQPRRPAAPRYARNIVSFSSIRFQRVSWKSEARSLATSPRRMGCVPCVLTLVGSISALFTMTADIAARILLHRVCIETCSAILKHIGCCFSQRLAISSCAPRGVYLNWKYE